MICIIQRNLFDIEKLEKIEAEEVVRIGISGSEIPLVYLSSNIDELIVFIIDWSIIFPMLLFSFGLFADLRISDIVETSFDIRLGFWLIFKCLR